VRLSHEVLRAIHWDTAGALVTSAITFLTTVWMVRVLGPEPFGALAALLALLGLGQLLASGGVRVALLRFVPVAMQEGGPVAVGHLLRRALITRSLLTLALALPCWLAPQAVAHLALGRPDLGRYVWILPFLLAPALYVDVFAAMLIALFRQRLVRVAEVVNKLVFALVLLLLPVWPDPLHGALAAWVTGWLAGAALLARGLSGDRCLPQGPPGAWERDRWGRFAGAAYALSLLGYILGRELDVLLLTRLGIRAEAVAQYAVCFAFVSTVLALPLLPIAGGFDVPLIARLHSRGDWDGLRRLYRAFFEYVYIFMLPLVGGGLILGPRLMGRIYGEVYGQTLEVFLPLLLLLGATKLGGITAPFLLATDRERTLFRIRLTAAGLNLAGALAAIPAFGGAGAAWATGLAALVTVAWEACVVQSFLRPRLPWGFLGRVAVATGAMMIAVSAGRWAAGAGTRLTVLMALVCLGGAVYLGMLLWLRPVSADCCAGLAGLWPRRRLGCRPMKPRETRAGERTPQPG